MQETKAEIPSLEERKMAKNKEDINYGTAQARVSEDDALRVRYKSGTPLEGGMIAESEPIDLFSSAHNIDRAKQQQQETQPQMQRPGAATEESAGATTKSSPSAPSS